MRTPVARRSRETSSATCDPLYLGLGKGDRGAIEEARGCRESVGFERSAVFLPIGLGKVISKPILFSLSKSWAKFRQVDTLRSHEHADKEF